MRYLRLGCRGTDVVAWGNFLRGVNPSSELVVERVFTSAYDDETRRFQRLLGLRPDGVVGPKTLAEALRAGYDPLSDEGEHEDGPNWPPRPDFGPILPSDRADVFGSFKFVSAASSGNPEGIRIVDDWVGENITKVTIPQLIGVPGAPKDGGIHFHTKASEQLRAMWQAWDDAGLIPLVLGFAGSWAPRFIRGSRSVLSNHAWGTAFDINVPWNYLGSQPALKGRKGSVRELVPVANGYGFYWGGHFSGRPDGMHFEVARLSGTGSHDTVGT